jgi:F-type H+-transporting ATPase subunit epsilon
MTAWRTLFTYATVFHGIESALTGIVDSYNKYAQITARALRNSLKEEERLAAERRGLTSARYQKWENGVGGSHVSFSAQSSRTPSLLYFSRLC